MKARTTVSDLPSRVVVGISTLAFAMAVVFGPSALAWALSTL